MLPTVDGYHVLRELRRDGYADPILVLTARDQEVDKVRGLRWGADDYVTKPFGVMELLARIDALLRRAAQSHSPSAQPSGYRFGTVRVDPAARLVSRRGEPVALTPMEFDLLIALLRRAGAAATRLELLQEVWGHSSAVLTRTVDTHVAELRRKLEDEPALPRHILTVRKIGYRLSV
jgi:two-component system alkaline phosphatase synthesis response regulator PhoP